MRDVLIGTALLAIGGVSCVDVSGGAVEARWDLRDGGATPITCGAGGVGTLRFALVPVKGGDDPCVADDRCGFLCGDGTGTTAFNIPEGDYAMSLLPRDAAGKSLGPQEGVAVPGPVVRQVLTGQVTDLSVNLIIVDR